MNVHYPSSCQYAYLIIFKGKFNVYYTRVAGKPLDSSAKAFDDDFENP